MRKRVIPFLLAAILVIAAAGYYGTKAEAVSEQQAFSELKEQTLPSVPSGSELHNSEDLSFGGEVSENNDIVPVYGDEDFNEATEITEPENASRFAHLISANEDFAAWLSIDGTHIDYPVMQSPDEPDYYLRRDFDKKDSVSGTPYMGSGCGTESDNILVYGHNMKNGTMFSDLLLYEDQEFYGEHPFISFDTVEKSGQYKILAVFRDKVHYKDEKGFKYYDYAGSLTEESFNEYVSNIKQLSAYDTGTDASYGDQLITLSTCAYHTTNGRFVVVAVSKSCAQ